MLHKEIAGLSVLFFLLWIFVASSGAERIQRVCAPIDWTGNIVLSAAALASPDSQHTLARGADKVVYGCEYIIWRLFYQDGFDEWNRKRQAAMFSPPALSPDDEASKSPSEPADDEPALPPAEPTTPPPASAAAAAAPTSSGSSEPRVIE